MSKKWLLLNLALSQSILLLISFSLQGLFYKGYLRQLFYLNINVGFITVFLAGIAGLLAVQVLFYKYIDKESLLDKMNLLLLRTFSLPELVPVFLCGAFTEELLFRGTLQTLLGPWPAAVLFTLVHFRYFPKYFLLLEVFLMGLILACVFSRTGTLWAPVFCHFTLNYLTAVFVKKEIFREKRDL